MHSFSPSNLPQSPNFGEVKKLAKKFFEILKEKKIKCVIVECSTGGFISSEIVKNVGASEVFLGAFLPYSNELKSFLSADLSDGAVSEKCALSLAKKAKDITNADLVISETSILGPKGGTETKPVGLSFLAIVSNKGEFSFVNLFRGNRDKIMKYVASSAFFFAINHILGWNLQTRKVASTFVEYKGKILILKRSKKVGSYRGKWGVVSGHIEEGETEEETSLKELKEEIGLDMNLIDKFTKSTPFELSDVKLGIRWEIAPFRAILKTKPEIKIDWEHVKYLWIKPSELSKFKTAPLLYQGYLKNIFNPINTKINF
ncbi:MAG: nicotinamide-nucleotide amidohydrolase family protein [Candidatus Calescibacterium sp.]|jgi:PncC family amidohydrolase